MGLGLVEADHINLAICNKALSCNNLLENIGKPTKQE